jgi:hypothetical protein
MKQVGGAKVPVTAYNDQIDVIMLGNAAKDFLHVTLFKQYGIWQLGNPKKILHLLDLSACGIPNRFRYRTLEARLAKRNVRACFDVKNEDLCAKEPC